MLFAASLFLILPFIKKPLVRNEFANLIFRRGSWIVGIALMSLNSAIIATIAAKSNLPLADHFLFSYMWIFNWSAITLMFFMFLMTIFNLVQIKKRKDDEERYGDD